MSATPISNSASSLPGFCNFDRLFDAAKKSTVIQLRWPLVILSSYLLVYSPGYWLSTPQTHAVLIFYLFTNATLYFVVEEHFNSPYFYGPLLLFDTIFFSLVLGLSGGTTPDFYVACFFTLILSCICNDSRGLLVITFLAPALYAYIMLSGAATTAGPEIYLRLPFPMVIAIFYGYFAQVERLKRLVKEKEEQADREREAANEIRRQRERIDVLHQINSAVIANIGLSQILEVFLEKALMHLPYTAAIVQLRDCQSGELQAIAAKGFAKLEPGDSAVALLHLNEILNRRSIPTAADIDQDEHLREIDFLRAEGLVALLGLPIRGNGPALGSLAFFTRRQYRFPREEKDFAVTFANQLALAIEHARMYEQIEIQARELREANKLKDEFLAVVSHELKTPLNIISGYTAMLIDGMMGGITPIQEKALQTMMRQSKELHAMISSVLQVCCLESNLLKAELHETNLWEFLFELKSSYEYPLDKDIQVDWDFSSELPVLQADRGKLKHILQNVINNAIKFTQHGSVTVRARYLHAQEVMEFQIADTGIGIPQGQSAAIFEKFRQVDSTDARMYNGVGLGLYIVRKFVDLLNGAIEVASKPGKGSTFTIRIPSEQCHARTVDAHSALLQVEAASGVSH